MMKLKIGAMGATIAFLALAAPLKASLTPGEAPCSFPQKPLLSKVTRVFPILKDDLFGNSKARLESSKQENRLSCSQEVQNFIHQDPLYRRRWQEAAKDPRSQERLLKEVNSLFYRTGKQLRKTILAAQKLHRLSHNNLSTKKIRPLPWLVNHQARVLGKNLKNLDVLVKKAGPRAELSWFDPQWEQNLNAALKRAQRQYALFTQNQLKEEKIRRGKLAIASRRLNAAKSQSNNFDNSALNSTLDSNESSSVHPAGSGEAGAVMAVFFGKKVLKDTGQTAGQ